ncbi:hypothetical protein FGIG_06687 [Fasciola gigantica]|uniref:SEA domain-containing protein n=1 Tax=Fasciola gigantica TaxID=46835 RepID=A0A504YIS2_FASGI|nr:hypothetical protein FGIG_06687 [Fasciola gigantica]
MCIIQIISADSDFLNCSGTSVEKSAEQISPSCSTVQPEFYYALDFTPFATVTSNVSKAITRLFVRSPTANSLPPVNVRILEDRSYKSTTDDSFIRIVVCLPDNGHPMEWDNELSDPHSARFKRTSQDVCNFFSNVAHSLQVQPLERLTCQVEGFRRGSVYSTVFLKPVKRLSKTFRSVNTAQSLAKGIRNVLGDRKITDRITLGFRSARDLTISAILHTYEVKVQMNIGGKPMEWTSDLEDPNSDAHQSYSRALCDFFLKSAEYSSELQNKKVKCRVLQFLRGSVYGVTELVVEASSADAYNTTNIGDALEEGAATFVKSVPTETSTVSFSSLADIVHVSTEVITTNSSSVSTTSATVISTVGTDHFTTTTATSTPASSSSGMISCKYRKPDSPYDELFTFRIRRSSTLH